MTAKPAAMPDRDEEAFKAAVEAGIDDADKGRTIPYEHVRKWLLSWGSDKELPPPECP
jgi:predicted transcriptional regulator